MRKYLFLLIMVLVLPVDAFGHSLYIQSGRYQVYEGKSSPLFFCYGHHIPVDDAVRGKKFSYVRVTDPSGASKDIEVREGKSLHSHMVKYDKPGTWVLTAETVPGYFTLWYDKKGRKRHTMRPMNTIAAQASKVETALRARQWTKTYVVCDEPSKEFPAEVGLPLELVPGKDVSLLKPGETLGLRVFMDGKPYTGSGFYDATYMGFSLHAEDMYIPRTEVQDGRILLPLDVPGRWFVRFFTKTDAPEDKKGEFLQEKRTATLVFEVPGPRKRSEIDGH